MSKKSTRARMNVHPVMTSDATPTRRALIGQTYDIERPLVTTICECSGGDRTAGVLRQRKALRT